MKNKWLEDLQNEFHQKTVGAFQEKMNEMYEKIGVESPYVKDNEFEDGESEQDEEDEPMANWVRLLFYGGANNDDENNTFEAAAIIVQKEYQKDKETIHGNRYFNILKEDLNAKKIVASINAQNPNTIQSIDFFTHGGQNALFFKRDDNGQDQDLYMDKESNENRGANSSDIGQIKYDKFTNGAKIEIHGCNSGDIKYIPNLASKISKALYKASKKNAVVIAHGEQANPNNHKTLQGSDYRHGLRRAYHNGETLFITKKEGRITGSQISKFLKLKKQQGSQYNGKNKWLK